MKMNTRLLICIENVLMKCSLFKEFFLLCFHFQIYCVHVLTTL